MDRNPHESRDRWATGFRAATVVVVLGTLIAAWHPLTHETPAAAPDATAPATTSSAPDMSVYFPDRFSAPTKADDEPPAPTF